MASDDSPSIMRFLGGVGLGVVMTYVYVRYAWAMPEVAQLPGKITEAAVVTTAAMDLFSPEASEDVRRRAFSVVMSQKAEEFVEIDRELDSPLLEEVLRREAVRQTKLIKHQMPAYDVALEQPSLREALERKHGRTDDNEELKRRMLLSAIHEEEFAAWYIRTRFPHLTPDKTVDLVLGVYQNELRPVRQLAAEAEPALQ